jgi:hypothetical protein
MKKVYFAGLVLILTLALVGMTCEGRSSTPDAGGGAKKAATGGAGPQVNPDGTVTFTYAGGGSPQAIFLAGSFNGWNPGDPQYALEDLEGDGKWSITIPIDPGSYQYKFVIDGAWTQDESNPESAPDGFGGNNSIINVN